MRGGDAGAAAGRARGYDLMAGTGEVWPHLLKRFDDIGAITAVDISSGMHRRAMERLHAHRAHRIEFIEDDVLASDLPSESADFVISTFGLKTFNPEQHARLAALIARVLKPGGVFSHDRGVGSEGMVAAAAVPVSPQGGPAARRAHLLRGAQDFAMIGTYSTNFGNAAESRAMLRDHGLEVEFSKYFFGCATGVAGRKISAPRIDGARQNQSR